MEKFRAKSEEELRQQLELAESTFGGEKVAQPSSKENITSLPFEELKAKFPKRYEIYLKTLRAKKSGQELAPEEVEGAKRWLVMLNNLDNYITNHKFGESERTLRERQFTVFEDMRDFLEKGNTEGYVKLPTGVGKTVLFTEFLESLGSRTLIVVPTTQLVSQTIERLREFAPTTESGRVFGGAKEFGANVIVTTYASLVSQVEQGGIKPEEFDCVILDEAHRSLSEKRMETVDKFDQAIKLGFTATPEFSSSKKVSHLLKTEIHSMSIPEAVEEGLLSSFSVIIAKTNVNLEKVKIDTDGDYSDRDLEQAVNIESRNLSAVQLYKEMFNGELATVFCVSIQHAERLVEMFNQEGVPAAAVTGKTKNSEEILQRFSQGEIKVVCTVDKLIEGFDEPRASVALNLRPTLSRIIAEQRGGRIMRLDPENPEKLSTIIEFIDQSEKNNRFSPVTFAEVVDETEIYQGNQEDKRVLSQPSRKEQGGSTKNIPKISGIEIITDKKEILRMISGFKEKRSVVSNESPPEGWMTKKFLTNHLRASKKWIAARLKPLLESHPEWQREYLTRSVVAIHYHPDLIRKLEEMREKLKGKESVPSGWMSMRAIRVKLKTSGYWVSSRIPKFTTQHPEWVEQYPDRTGQVKNYYHPDLLKKLEEEKTSREVIPDKWMTVPDIMNQLGRPRSWVVTRVRELEKKHPGWEKKYPLTSTLNRPISHYHPDLIAKLKKMSYQEK